LGSHGTVRVSPGAGSCTWHLLSGCRDAVHVRSCRRRAGRSASRRTSGPAAGCIAHLECDGAGEPCIYPASRLVEFDSQACNAALPLDACDDIVWEVDNLEGLSEHELPRFKDDGVSSCLLCPGLHRLAVVRIDHFLPLLVPEEMVTQPDIKRIRLDEPFLKRLDLMKPRSIRSRICQSTEDHGDTISGGWGMYLSFRGVVIPGVLDALSALSFSTLFILSWWTASGIDVPLRPSHQPWIVLASRAVRRARPRTVGPLGGCSSVL